MEITFRVAQGGIRLDRAVTDYLQQLHDTAALAEVVPTRSKVSVWINEGAISIDGKVVDKPSTIVQPGAEISIVVPSAKPLRLEPDPTVVLSVVYEDDAVLILDKPAGLTVHPGAGQRDQTLVQGLLAYLGEDIRQVGDGLRPGLVHRLDKDTSGLMVVAKTDRAYQSLVKQFVPPRTIARSYLAFTLKVPNGGQQIHAPIGRDPRDRKRMAVVETGKPAQTIWEVVEQWPSGVLLELQLTTGRTHQIRVHLAHCNAGIVGDPLYGPNLKAIPTVLRGEVARLGRQALHAYQLQFIHPVSGEEVCFRSPLPEDLQRLATKFRQS